MAHRIYRFEIPADGESVWVGNTCWAWDPGFERRVVLHRDPMPQLPADQLEESIRCANNLESDWEVFIHEINFSSRPTASQSEGDTWRNPGLSAPSGRIYHLTAKGKNGACLVCNLDLRNWQGHASAADPPVNCESS